MREILFRGKRVDNGEWVEGSLIKVDWRNKPTTYSIMPTRPTACNYIVIPETVGQCTGLTDKNGVRIFEGMLLEPLHVLVKYTFLLLHITMGHSGLKIGVGQNSFSNLKKLKSSATFTTIPKF